MKNQCRISQVDYTREAEKYVRPNASNVVSSSSEARILETLLNVLYRDEQETLLRLIIGYAVLSFTRLPSATL